MFPFFETIRYINGIAENLFFHQLRIDNTLLQLNGNKSIQLLTVITSQTNKPSIDNLVYKCRVKYNIEGDTLVTFEPYSIKEIKSLSIKDIGDNNYNFKYTNRDWLISMLKESHSDEIILTQKGLVKDATYANLAFYDGVHWITPDKPLLYGTRRAQLLTEGIIIEQPIHIHDLSRFKYVKLINAMMRWEESPMIVI